MQNISSLVWHVSPKMTQGISQWLEFCASTAEGTGSVLVRGTKIPWAMRCDPKKKKKTKMANKNQQMSQNSSSISWFFYSWSKKNVFISILTRLKFSKCGPQDSLWSLRWLRRFVISKLFFCLMIRYYLPFSLCRYLYR